MSFLSYFASNSLFTFFIVFISFVLGWVMYHVVLLKTVDLKDSLFTKDNPAAWAEFIGAFIFPVLDLAARAVVGSASPDIFLDLAICLGDAAVYIAVFVLLRLLTDLAVRRLSPPDSDGKIDLNNEIYRQRNVSASLFSIAVSLVFVCVLSFLDFWPENILSSLLKIADILVYTSLATALYILVLRRKTSFLSEIFVDNNTAAGVSFLGFVCAVEILLGSAISLQKGFNFPILVAISGIGLVILGVFSVIFRVLFSRIIRVNLWGEIYDQNNTGAGLGQAALYISIANVIISFMR